MTKEEKKEYAKEYYRRNKEKINAKSKESTTRKQAAPNTIIKIWEIMLER